MQNRTRVLVGLICLLLLIPLCLCNNPGGAITSLVVFAFLFFLPGYLLLSFSKVSEGGLRILLSFVFGVLSVTTAYNFAARASIGTYFVYLMLAFSCVGLVVLVRQLWSAAGRNMLRSDQWESPFAGIAIALSIAPLYWRSGRFSDGNFVFYGPAGQDPLFHITLLRRLLHHIPPDNFIVSGLRAPVYHYFDDLLLAFAFTVQQTLHLGSVDLFDLYYRVYPTILYFLVGALAYRAGRQLLGKIRGGILSVLLLLGAGGMGWVLGALQTIAHEPHVSRMRQLLFSEWTSWNGVDAILPLVHRPAHYHSLLICLAAINLWVSSDRRRDWLAGGLLLGLMAGFNFTLAATLGVASVIGAVLLRVKHGPREASNVAFLALAILVGSLPVVLSMVLSGVHNPAPGFPFRGPNLEFTTEMWGHLLRHVLPVAVIPTVALLMFPVFAYGVKLAGLASIRSLELGEPRNRQMAALFSGTLLLSFAIGTFFPYKGLGGIAVVFIQPTLWILALFSLRPLSAWLESKRGSWWPRALWGMLLLTWIQALGAFNFGHRAIFSAGAVNLFQGIHTTAAPDDVVAYLPDSLVHEPVWGEQLESTNFAVTALTGLDGYLSSKTYSVAFAIPGLRGKDDATLLAEAERLYNQRADDVQAFLKGTMEPAPYARLAADHVCWIVVSHDAMLQVNAGPTPWKTAGGFAAYRLCP